MRCRVMRRRQWFSKGQNNLPASFTHLCQFAISYFFNTTSGAWRLVVGSAFLPHLPEDPCSKMQGNALSSSPRDSWRYCTCSEGFRQNCILEEFTNSARSQQGESILPRFPWNSHRAPDVRNLLSFLPGHPSGSSTIQVYRALGQPAARQAVLQEGTSVLPQLSVWDVSGIGPSQEQTQEMHSWEAWRSKEHLFCERMQAVT